MLTPLLPIFEVKAGLALVYICQQARIMWKSTLTDKIPETQIVEIIWEQKNSIVYFFIKVLQLHKSNSDFKMFKCISLFWIESRVLGFTYSSYCGIYIIWGLSWVEMCWGPNYLFLILLLLLLESVADFKEVSSRNFDFFLFIWVDLDFILLLKLLSTLRSPEFPNKSTFYGKLKNALLSQGFNSIEWGFFGEAESHWIALPLAFTREAVPASLNIHHSQHHHISALTHHWLHRRRTGSFHRTREQLLLNRGWKQNFYNRKGLQMSSISWYSNM